MAGLSVGEKRGVLGSATIDAAGARDTVAGVAGAGTFPKKVRTSFGMLKLMMGEVDDEA